ncbi:MAG TPA: vanillic acid non-oxidative decarboxylation protein [Clostridium sp.]|jgi:transposase-like protein|nr:vanillic acid non-oxidative decarboxylation protein [Clostridiales bacterium]HBC95382.1 vanillic acid non-oxidative decarboxylation protein [Clostridium sp.]
MICPRCESENVEVMAKSPNGDAWEVYICNDCCFSWRSTEDSYIRDPKKYNKKFKINREEIKNLPKMPPVPEIVDGEK